MRKGTRTKVARTRDAMDFLEQVFTSPAVATDDAFESTLMVDELGGILAAGLTRTGIGTAALLDARKIILELERATNLTRDQVSAIAAMRDALEAWG